MFFKIMNAAVLAVASGVAAASAATLDFDGLAAGSYANPGPSNQYFEDGFYYRLDGIDAVSTLGGIELARTPGQSAVFGSQTSFWGPTAVGGFAFAGIDWRSLEEGRAADILVTGRDFMSGDWFTDVFRSTTVGYQSFAAGNLQGYTLDQLWIVIDQQGVGPGAFDNLELRPVNVHPRPVPLPAAGWMMLAGVAVLARRRA